MLACNGANESTLGKYCLHAQDKPTDMMHEYNVLILCTWNDTENFMCTKFEEVDYTYCQTEARTLNSSRKEN